MVLAKEIGSYDYQQRGYELLAKLKEKQELYRSAYEAKEKAFNFRDSVMAQNNEVRILELENRFKGKEASQQIQLLTTEKALTEKNKTDQQRIFFLLILLLSGFIGFLYYRNRNGLKLSRELEKVNEIKSKFFGNVSHEFRTPLTLIKGPLENWLDSDLSPELRKDATMMLRNSERLLFLVDQLLSLSKVDSGNFQIAPQHADLSLAIKGISNFYVHFANDKSIKYNIDIEDSGEIWVDLQIVEIIVTNILSNAFKFTDSGGNIYLIGKKKKDEYVIKIANSGERLTNDKLSKLFERYYTDGPSHYSGSGIGLSLVKELCSLYGAKVSVSYNDNNDIEFTVIFPPLQKNEQQLNSALDDALDLTNTERFHTASVGAVVTSSLMDETSEEKDDLNLTDMPLLLVVEDNQDLRRYVVECFKDEYHVIEAKDGVEGVSKALEQLPDIIISDIMMPKLDGLELCNRLKSDSLTNHIPIILLTALNEEKDLIAGLKNKADDYVIKPFGMSRAQLYRKLKATVDMSVSEFIRVHRVKLASEFLKDRNLNVSDACYASGFSDASYFSKSFKDVFKVPPAQYRKQLHSESN